MWDIIGAYSLCGLALIVLTVPAQILTSKLTASFRTKTNKLTDKRIKIMNEVLSGMRVR